MFAQSDELLKMAIASVVCEASKIPSDCVKFVWHNLLWTSIFHHTWDVCRSDRDPSGRSQYGYRIHPCFCRTQA